MFKKAIAIAAMLGTVAGYACTSNGVEGIVEDNNLWISPHNKMSNGMTEAKFNQIIDKVVAIYQPIVTGMGGKLNVVRNWDDGTVNAYAQRSGRNWSVSMFGGLARHEAITDDGFALVICHEIGHHIGGAPKKAGWFSTWASNEGQADYFATLKCLRRVFRAEAETTAQIVKGMTIPTEVVSKCAEQFTADIDQQICQRGAMAGMSTAKLFQALRNSTTAPDFTTPDAEVVGKTDDQHPATQCRLDTYYSGALCQIDENQDVDQDDEAVGVCYRKSGDTTGVRPLCWFKPDEA